MWCWLRWWGILVVGLLWSSGCYIDQNRPHPSRLQGPCVVPGSPGCVNPIDGGLTDTPIVPQTDRNPHGGLYCGNQRCEPTLGESCVTCPQDCGCAAGQICANGTCTFCGNQRCEPGLGETCATCLSDCGCGVGAICVNATCQKPVQCGDGLCTQPLESCTTCPADCACQVGEICKAGQCAAEPFCGDRSCEAARGENCETCPQDCGCQNNQGCRNGNCYQCLCNAGQKRCFNEQIQQCSASCLEWQTVAVCQAADGQVCNPTTQACECNPSNVCTSVGAGRCGKGGVRETCTKGRLCFFWQTNPCQPRTPDHTMVCDEGDCCECFPGQRACHGPDVYEICGVDCLWGKPIYCPPGDYCSLGICRY